MPYIRHGSHDFNRPPSDTPGPPSMSVMPGGSDPVHPHIQQVNRRAGKFWDAAIWAENFASNLFILVTKLFFIMVFAGVGLALLWVACVAHNSEVIRLFMGFGGILFLLFGLLILLAPGRNWQVTNRVTFGEPSDYIVETPPVVEIYTED